MTTATQPTKVLAQQSGKSYHLYNADCIELTRTLADESIDFSIFSPPFASLYTYSNSSRDMGNCLNEKEFFEYFAFLVTELFRVTKPGRVVAVHCMELPRLKSKDGHIGVYEFPDDIRSCFREHGFHYDGCCTIWKDPVTAMQRTKSIRLLHKQLCKDSTLSSWALPDYVCKFKKPGVNPEPVIGELDHFAGEQQMFSPSGGKLSINVWQRYASPVWSDINQSNTLQHRAARESEDEKHICPLQLDVIERCVQLWSNENDVVLSPFAGIGSEGFVACKLRRRFIGVELKESYFKVACKNLEAGELKARETRLF